MAEKKYPMEAITKNLTDAIVNGKATAAKSKCNYFDQAILDFGIEEACVYFGHPKHSTFAEELREVLRQRCPEGE